MYEYIFTVLTFDKTITFFCIKPFYFTLHVNHPFKIDSKEAIMQMELLEHDFFVFLNADTNSINVVYKRKDNQYGLIQPTLD